MTEMIHFAIDLETLGTAPGAPILSLALVPFTIHDEGTAHMVGDPDATFSARILFDDAVAQGQVDRDTLLWWVHPERREALNQTIPADQSGAETEADALTRLVRHLDRLPFTRNQRFVWGNGASFDCAILAAAFRRQGLVVPWPYWHERDMRTLGHIVDRMGGSDAPRTFPDPGAAHTALADAIAQAQTIVRWWNWMLYRTDDVVTPA